MFFSVLRQMKKQAREKTNTKFKQTFEPTQVMHFIQEKVTCKQYKSFKSSLGLIESSQWIRTFHHLLPMKTLLKGEIKHNIESVPKVSHLWGKMDFL